ncbi:MAG: type II toxin-antitoxin system VapC family toxin [Thermoplasmataceae archaeon]
MKGDKMTASYIMDSSSLFTLFFIESEDTIRAIMTDSYILDLTGYEIGSVLTKGKDGHIKGLKNDVIIELTKEIEKVICKIKVIRLSPVHISEIMTLSASIGLTFYDASYVFYSKRLNLALLTDDREMYDNAKKIGIEVRKVEELPI